MDRYLYAVTGKANYVFSYPSLRTDINSAGSLNGDWYVHDGDIICVVDTALLEIVRLVEVVEAPATLSLVYKL